MTLLNLNVDDAEIKTLSEGEYTLRLLNAEVKTSQKGNAYLNLHFDVPSEPSAQDIYHIMMLPTGAEGDEKNDNRKKVNIKRWKQAFDIVGEEIDLEAIVGYEGVALLKEEEDEEFGIRNIVKKFMVSH